MQNISKHITYAEATRSEAAAARGIANTPNDVHLTAMRYVAERVFEPMRAHFGEAIRINSFFRSQQVNALIGGAVTSQHMKGEAIDIGRYANSKYTLADLFWYIREHLVFDQLIWEHGTDSEPGWVHVSLKPSGNRREVLQAYKQSGLTKYKQFILEKKKVIAVSAATVFFVAITAGLIWSYLKRKNK